MTQHRLIQVSGKVLVLEARLELVAKLK